MNAAWESRRALRDGLDLGDALAVADSGYGAEQMEVGALALYADRRGLGFPLLVAQGIVARHRGEALTPETVAALRAEIDAVIAVDRDIRDLP